MSRMQKKAVKVVPVLITVISLCIVCLLQILPKLLPDPDFPDASRFDFFHRLEWMTYDARVRFALRFPHPGASNLLGAVFIDDKDLKDMNDGS